MKKSMLDEDGVDFLGMRLAVVLVAAALLIALAAVYVNDHIDKASKERARQEARRIASIAGSEYASGAPGSTAPVSVSIPDSVRRMAFIGRAYSIEFRDGSKEVYTAECRFSPAELYPGYHLLELETVAGDGGYAISLREA